MRRRHSGQLNRTALDAAVLALAVLGTGCNNSPTLVPVHKASRSTAASNSADALRLLSSSRIETALNLVSDASETSISYATETQVMTAVESANAAVTQAARAEASARAAADLANSLVESTRLALTKGEAAATAADRSKMQAEAAESLANAAVATANLAAAKATTVEAQTNLALTRAQAAADSAQQALLKAQQGVDAANVAAQLAASADAKAVTVVATAARAEAQAQSAATAAAAAEVKAAAADAKSAALDAKVQGASDKAAEALSAASGASAKADQALSGLQQASTMVLTAQATADLALAKANQALDSRVFVNIKDFGAKGDGVTDDTASIQTAINQARNAKSICYIPSGVYRVGLLDVTASMDGVGTFKAKDNPKDAYDFVRIPTGTSDVTISNITFDGNLTGTGPGNGTYKGTRGLQVFGHNASIRNVTVRNTFNAGIMAYYVNGLSITGSRISNCRGVYGDGIFCAGTKDSIISGNFVSDFTRIGIVGELAGTYPSVRLNVSGNVISNGHDSSGGEYNAGIWLENADSAVIAGNIIQSTGEAGITLSPTLTATSAATFDLSDNHISTVNNGIRLGGQTAFANFKISGGVIYNVPACGVKLYNCGGIASIDGVHFGTTNLAYASSGLIQVDNSASSATLSDLRIANCSKLSNTYAPSAADLNVVSAGTAIQSLWIKDMIGDWSLVMRQPVENLNIQGSRIASATNAFQTLNARMTNLQDTTLLKGTGQLRLYNGTGAPTLSASGCKFEDVAVVPATSSAQNLAEYRACQFRRSQIQHNIGELRLSDSTIVDSLDSSGFVRHGLTNAAYSVSFARNKYTSSLLYPFASMWNFPPTAANFEENEIDGPLVSGYSPTSFVQKQVTRTVTGGPVALKNSDRTLNCKSLSSASLNITLPPYPILGQLVTVKDLKGDASANPLVLRAASGTINGSATAVINSDFGSLELVFSGTEWRTNR